MNKLLICLVTSLIAFNTTLADQTTEGILIQPQKYATMDEAATSGLRQSFELSNRYEYAGVVYKKIGSEAYFTSTPQTQFNRTQVHHSAPQINGYLLVAGYHTHPCIEGQELWAPYFSEQDQHSAAAQNIYGYLSDMCTGQVHKIAPQLIVASLTPPPLWKDKEVKSNITFHNFGYNRLLFIDVNVFCDNEYSIKVEKNKEVLITNNKRVKSMSCKEFKYRMFGSY